MLAIAGAAHTGRTVEATALLATLMGGAAWHHAVGEGHPGAAVGAATFLGLSMATAAANGVTPTQAIGGGLALAAVGWAIGAMLPRTPEAPKKQKK